MALHPAEVRTYRPCWCRVEPGEAAAPGGYDELQSLRHTSGLLGGHRVALMSRAPAGHVLRWAFSASVITGWLGVLPLRVWPRRSASEPHLGQQATATQYGSA